MRKTGVLEKLIASVINVIIVFVLSLPLFFYFGLSKEWIYGTILIFFIYNLVILLLFNNRCIGMCLVRTHWEKKYSPLSGFVYAILYTLSFSTLFIWIKFPFDLFILNMILQFICVSISGTTIHGYLSGRMHTVKKKK